VVAPVRLLPHPFLATLLLVSAACPTRPTHLIFVQPLTLPPFLLLIPTLHSSSYLLSFAHSTTHSPLFSTPLTPHHPTQHSPSLIYYPPTAILTYSNFRPIILPLARTLLILIIDLHLVLPLFALSLPPDPHRTTPALNLDTI
jgi:hypothetical protein